MPNYIHETPIIVTAVVRSTEPCAQVAHLRPLVQILLSACCDNNATQTNCILR